MRLKKLYLLIAIVGIVLALSVGGYFIYRLFFAENGTQIPGFSQDEPVGDTLQEIPLPQELSTIMAVPAPDASPAAFQQYRANIEYNAKAADKVVISDCTPNPMVLKVMTGKTFKLENKDIKPHVIIVNDTHRYSVDPKATIDITADFGNGLGIYSYSCDNPAIPAGVFLVRETL